MFERNRFLNRLFKHPYFLYRFWDGRVYLGKQIVPQKGTVKPKWGGNEYPFPNADDQKYIYDYLETWVDVDVRQFEPLHSSPMPEWKQHPITGVIREKAKEEGVKLDEATLKKKFDVFMRKFQHFNPYVVRSFSEGHSFAKVMAGKPDKMKEMLPFVAIIVAGAVVLVLGWMIIKPG